MKLRAALVPVALFALVASAQAASDWMPATWADEDTLQFRTDCPEEGEHWSYVWLVVLDGDVWVRLGSKAAERVDCSRTGRTTSVKIAGEQFDNVELAETPEMAERVANAMAEKYSTDIFVRYFAHPYTMKPVPKEAASEEAKEPAAP
jgi:hypothetical protein